MKQFEDNDLVTGVSFDILSDTLVIGNNSGDVHLFDINS